MNEAPDLCARYGLRGIALDMLGPSFCRWGHRGPEVQRDLPKVTQLVQETQPPLSQGPEHFALPASQQRHIHYSAGHKCKFNWYAVRSLPAAVGWLVSALETSFRNRLALIAELSSSH